MLSSAFAAALALLSMQQVRDASTTTRDAYTECLRTYMNTAIRERTAADAFRAALPQQCQDQERAFRAAIAARERGFSTPASEVTQIANDEVEDARSNIRDLFEMGTTPR